MRHEPIIRSSALRGRTHSYREVRVRTAAPSDEQLFDRFRQRGDRNAFEELVRRWHVTAFRIARSICRDKDFAEETVQEAFLKLVAIKDSFENRGPNAFRAWFLTIVTKCARTRRRTEFRASRKKYVEPKDRNTQPATSTSLSSSTTSMDPELRRKLESLLDGLEENLRIPVVLHLVDDMKQKEVADLLGVSQQLISKRIRQGLEALRTRLAQAGFAMGIGPLSEMMPQAGLYAPDSAWIQAIQQLSPEAEGAPLPAAPVTPGRVTAALLITALLVTVSWMSLKDSGSDNETEAKSPTPTVTGVGLSDKPFPWSWNFDHGFPDELKTTMKGYRWQERGSVNGSGALSISDDFRFEFTKAFPDEIVLSYTLYMLDNVKDAFWGVTHAEFQDTRLSVRMGKFMALEKLFQARSIQRMEVYASKRTGFVGVTLNGKPFMKVNLETDRDKKLRPIRALLLKFVQLDNLQIRPANPEDEKQWAHWLQHQTVYDEYRTFDSNTRRKMWGLFFKTMGPNKLRPGAGKNGSGALHCRGTPENPLFLAASIAGGEGHHLIQFDWKPLDASSARADLLNNFPGPLRKWGFMENEAIYEHILNIPPNHLVLDLPNKVDRAMHAQPNQWHRVTFIAGAKGNMCLLNGELAFARTNDKESPRDIDGEIVRIDGNCLIDNFRIRTVNKPIPTLIAEEKETARKSISMP